MASGLPVIVTDACGSAELVEPGVTGWIVPASDSAALAGALETALRCRAGLAVMGERARAAAERHIAQIDWRYFGRVFSEPRPSGSGAGSPRSLTVAAPN